MACSGHSGSVVSTRLIVLPSLSNGLALVIKLGHAAPPLFELRLGTGAPDGAFVLGPPMLALGFGMAPFDPPFKFTLDVGGHGGWAPMHHVITNP